MTWPVIPGAPHGGPLPSVVIDGLSSIKAYAGDQVVISGSGFTPGTQIYLNPGNILIGTSMPTITDEITVTIPYGLANQRYVMTVTNGAYSQTTNIYVVRDIEFSTNAGQVIDIIIGELS